MIKLGIIGLGRMGGYHASVCQMIPQVQLIGVADHNEQLLSKVTHKNVLKSRNFNDWIDLVDAVIIAVPTEFHFSVAQECIQRGKHVLIEKPLTKNLEQAIELFNMAHKHDVALHVGHVERFNGAIQELRKIIDQPYLIESHRMGPFDTRVKNDSIVLDLMIHDLDIVTNLVNAPVQNFNVYGSKVFTDSCDLASVQLHFQNNVIANLVSSRCSQIKKRTMAIHQKDAYISLDFTTQDITIHRRISASVDVGTDQLKYKQEALVEHVFVYKENPLRLEIEHFIAAIKHKKDLRNKDQDLVALCLTFDIEKQLGIR